MLGTQMQAIWHDETVSLFWINTFYKLFFVFFFVFFLCSLIKSNFNIQ
jgi:hypothetical protein